jgi:DNA-binding winged helix-turn-helix (wHTH) protein
MRAVEDIGRRSPSVYRLGPFEVDLRTRELRKYGIRISLQTQPFEVLAFLLERAGLVVTRSELRDRLWGGEVHVDFEHSLNRIVAKLRLAFGESADAPRFIETQPGQGYRILHAQVIVDPRLAGVPEPIRKMAFDSPGPLRGALALQSPYYVERQVDLTVSQSITAQDSVVLLKGPRQTGKTSLLARVLDQARRSGTQTLLTDFQKFNSAHLKSIEAFLPKLGASMAEQAGIEFDFAGNWSPHRGPSMNFDRFVKRNIFTRDRSIVWGIDEADRLFSFKYASEFFGLLRSWHNERALDAGSACGQVTIIIAYATEAHLFITDLNQSPFNVGTLVPVGDLTFDEVSDLHSRYGSPLNSGDLANFYRFFGGHPYLSQTGFREIVTQGWSYGELAAAALSEEGPLGEHLRRVALSVQQNPTLCQALCRMLAGQRRLGFDALYRLRSAGLIRGDSPRDAEPRCVLYRDYLSRNLL